MFVGQFFFFFHLKKDVNNAIKMMVIERFMAIFVAKSTAIIIGIKKTISLFVLKILYFVFRLI